jgi:ribonuclease HI
MKVTIYTDGGADPNPGLGGWAAILLSGDKEKVLSGSEPSTTNNRMELTAAIAALGALKARSEIEFHTDSEYLRKGITEWAEQWQERGWQRKGKPVPNADLWQSLLALVKRHRINWHWIRGHSGDRYNERVDMLARKARLETATTESVEAGSALLFVRGTCKGNPGPGAWAAVLEQGEHTNQLSGTERSTTNNRMELRAVIGGLSLVPEGLLTTIITTSDYVFMGATRWIHGWRRRAWKKKDGQPVSNRDLWQELDALLAMHDARWLSGKGGSKRFARGLEEAADVARQALTLEK